MTTVSHEPSRVVGEKPSWSVELLVPEMWATLAIVVIWLAVLFAAIYGGDIVSTSVGGDHTVLPSAVPVALFAFLATWVVARYGFGRRKAKD